MSLLGYHFTGRSSHLNWFDLGFSRNATYVHACKLTEPSTAFSSSRLLLVLPYPHLGSVLRGLILSVLRGSTLPSYSCACYTPVTFMLYMTSLYLSFGRPFFRCPLTSIFRFSLPHPLSLSPHVQTTDLYNYIYNRIPCGVCSIIVWFAFNVPPSFYSTSACAVQINCFLVQCARVTSCLRACYVTFVL